MIFVIWYFVQIVLHVTGTSRQAAVHQWVPMLLLAYIAEQKIIVMCAAQFVLRYGRSSMYLLHNTFVSSCSSIHPFLALFFAFWDTAEIIKSSVKKTTLCLVQTSHAAHCLYFVTSQTLISTRCTVFLYVQSADWALYGLGYTPCSLGNLSTQGTRFLKQFRALRKP